ncbi:MAG: hypothetical protein QOD10_605 [Mycobacterium sp.]|jgi:hypothetical protein|nr:hypothetical protein [Mycobacterium sp.]
MPSITTWLRLEPRSRRETIDAALQARVYDPLWLLGRQWQMNEFAAHDGGSPVSAQLAGDAYRLTRIFTGDLPASGNATGQALDTSNTPLEMLVQREPYTHGSVVNARFAADAGRHFVRLLASHAVPQYAAAFLAMHPLLPPANLESESARFATALAGRVIDGAKLYAALTATPPATPAIAVNDQDLVDSAVQAWIDWYDQFISESPKGAVSAWLPARMEYAFAVGAATPDGEIVLNAPDYRGGPLDWYAFTHQAGASLGSPPQEAKREDLTRTAIPAPVTYPGMPAERWWQFEDARVDFGSIDTLPGDSAALVLLQFAITYGNDWLVIPVPVSVGSLCRVTSLTVTDSFGVPASVPPFSATTGAADGWRMFTVAARGEPDLLFVPPSAEAASPRTIETVSFARDEMANMGWAIEKKVLDAAGRVIDRTRALPPPEEHYGADELDYRLVTAVPENWIPLVPVSDPVSARVRLRRAVMAVTGATPPRPLGEVVGSGTSLVINDEELPRSGATVSRTLQYVRWIGGSTQFWLGRRKDAGQGEASSGLQFDTAQPRDAGSPPTG